jgi:hypothetical protein
MDHERNFNIFYNEAMAILAALKWAASLTPTPKRLAIHTDSTSSFSIFNTLHVLELYNPIIMEAVKIPLQHNIELRVFHIEGKKNVVADALSRRSLNLARSLVPGLSIRFFTPLLDMTGATKK